MSFTVSHLASFASKINGVDYMSVRRPIPIPRYSLDLQRYHLTSPARLWEISMILYKDPGYWAFIAEWNGIPEPSKYLIQYLPAQFGVYYLPEDLLEDYYLKRRIVTVAGAGSLE